MLFAHYAEVIAGFVYDSKDKPVDTILSRPVAVKQLPGPSLPKLMAEFNIDVDSGNIRISQFIYRICPGMSQDMLFSRAFAVPERTREGLVPSG